MAGPIRIAVLANASQARRELSGLSRETSSIGSKLSKVGKVAAVGLVGAAVAAAKFGKDSVKSASDAQQSLGATQTVFEKFSKAVIKTSDEAAKKYGLSANEYRENANLLGSLFKNQGVEVSALGDKTESMIGMASDLAATFGGTTKDAVEALGSAFKGEFDPLEKYGVSLKQSDVNARLAAKGQDNLTGAALKQAEQIAKTELITKQASQTAGAFAKESNTLAGQQQRVAAQFENVKAKIGTALLPILTALMAYISDTVLPTLSRWWDALAPARDVIGKLARGIGEIIGLIRGGNWDKAWAKFKEAASKAFSAVVQAAKDFIGQRLIPAIVRALAAARAAWARKWSDFWKDPASAYRKTEAETDSFGRRMVDRFDRVGINALLALMKSLRKMPGMAAKEGIAVLSGLKQGFSGAPALALAIGLSVVSNLRQGLESGRAMAAAVGTQIVMGLIDGIRWVGQRAVDAAVGVVKNAIAAAKSLLGISSPSKVFITIGRQIGDGLVIGLRRSRGRAARAGANLAKWVRKGVQRGSSGIEKVLDRVTRQIEKALDKRFDGKALKRHTKAVMKSLRDEYKALEKNARKQDRINRRLREARESLKDLRRQQRAYAASVRDSFVAYASVTNLDSAFNANAMAASMQARLEKMQQFAAALDALRAAGLNQSTLDQLIQGGVEGGLAYALALQQGGTDAVSEINDLQSQIGQVAGQLGQTAGSNMYDAGVAAAEGIVRGLEKAARKIDRAAVRLANKLVKAVKRALGISSPSRVFKGIGDNVTKGIAIGLDETYVKRQGAKLAGSLQEGFGTPALDAYARQQGLSDGRERLHLTLTAQQISQLQRGREIQADLDAYRFAGGRGSS